MDSYKGCDDCSFSLPIRKHEAVEGGLLDRCSDFKEWAHLSTCRRHAPRSTKGRMAYWPIVGGGDWCGEYQKSDECHPLRVLEDAALPTAEAPPTTAAGAPQ